MSISFLDKCDPPWVVFPQIQPTQLSRYLKQGVTEAWFDQQWRPFWSGLTPGQRLQYLDHWHASQPWRETIPFYFDEDEDFDLEADARESEEYLREWRHGRKK